MTDDELKAMSDPVLAVINPGVASWGPLPPCPSCAELRAALAQEQERESELREPMPGSYACEDCGRRDGLDAVVNKVLWQLIADDKHILCLWCMDRRAHERGLSACVALHFSGRALFGSDYRTLLEENERKLNEILVQMRVEFATLPPIR